MGCTQSKIENEETVSRCRNRREFMKEAVSARNAFVASHTAYAMALKNAGAALSDYATGEVAHDVSVESHETTDKESVFNHLPPPPPLPSFSDPLHRTSSMPEMKVYKEKMVTTSATISEEDEGGAGSYSSGPLMRRKHMQNYSSGGVGGVITEDETESHDEGRLMLKVNPRSGGGGGSISGDTDVESEKTTRERNTDKAAGMEGGHMRKNGAHDIRPDMTWDYFFPPTGNLVSPGSERAMDGYLPDHDEDETQSLSSEEKTREDEHDQPAAVEENMHKVEEDSMNLVGVESGEKIVGAGERRDLKNLLQVFMELDDQFLKCSECAHEVSKTMEATKLHYHSNFADNRGYIDHSARVMRVITWNRSIRGTPSLDVGSDDFDSEEDETLATVLDKLLAWEKKLYDEVKAGEIMKFEYQKKVALLNKQGSKSETLEKLKAEVSHLHTRYIVDMQSMDATVAEINRLRDEQLYPKLVQLVSGMVSMWANMKDTHDIQSKIVSSIMRIDISQSTKETSENHHDRTIQLWTVAQEWHNQFDKLVEYQKEYIKALNNWLRLNLIPIESNLKEKVHSTPRVHTPPIQSLLVAWDDFLEKLPHEVGSAAVGNIALAMHVILKHQEEELKLKQKCEDTRKELARKTRQFEEWYFKYTQKRSPEELDPEQEGGNPHTNLISERRAVVDAVRKRLEEEEEEYRKECVHVRERSLASLRSCLIELFHGLSNNASAFLEMYQNLRSITLEPPSS